MSREDAPEPVGYKNPPRHSRFQKGRSGNPSGRRKAQPMPDVFDVIGKVMAEPIQLMKNGKPRKVSYLEGLVRKTGEAAVKGDAAARRDLLKLLLIMMQTASAQPAEPVNNEQDEQVIERYLARMAAAGGAGHA